MKSVHNREYRAALNVLIEARKKARLTQRQVSALLAKPQSFVSKYEHGERRLDVGEFLKIILLVGADPHAAVDEIISASPGIELRVRKRPKKA